MNQRETDTRLAILNTLLTTPHRDLPSIYKVHADMIGSDPLFYRQLAAWYNDTGEIRDHKEMFIVSLCLSNFNGHRDVGLAMLRELPPYQLGRVIDFIHGKKIKVIDPAVKEAAKARHKTAKVKKGDATTATVTKVKTPIKLENFGLQKNIPNSMRTEIERYLREREADNDWFDSTATIAKKALKRLYALLHIKPAKRAQKILFDEDPPEDSKAYAIKQLANAKTPAEQAKIVMDLKLPFKVVTAVVSAMTPTVLLALVEVMSDQEIINSIGMLRKHGAFDNPDLKAAIEKKIEKASKGKRVSALKAKVAAEAAGVSDDVKEKLTNVADKQVKARGTIKRSTAILIDKSGSQQASINIGKQICAMVSAIAENDLFVYAFDTMAYPVHVGKILGGKKPELSDWERALAGINANGGTSIGIALKNMARSKQNVEQILIVSDGGETSQPSFSEGYAEYCAALNTKPVVGLLHVPGDTDVLSRNCQVANIQLDKWEIGSKSDYYSIPGLLQFLTGGSKIDLLMTIMEWEVPQRKAA